MDETVRQKIPFSKKLVDAFMQYGIIKTYKSGENTELINSSHSEYSFLISGLLKLFIEHENKKTILYHLEENQAFIPTFINPFNNSPITCSSFTIRESIIITIPKVKILEWSNNFSELKNFINSSNKTHYYSLLKIIIQLIEQPIEERVFDYLKLNSYTFNTNEIKVSRNEIASDLNFTRETVSRTLKKLEIKNRIIRKPRSILLNE